ncbi:MAG: 2OG-Fe(II) oxygenase, partial [Alphaproteobacteria bacterium]|nr:2OG-Fe(II) oxygenase [Alphaproteobacteria bacterium]
RIWTCENFSSPELCEWLVARAGNRFKPALMRDASTGTAQALESRTCSDFVFDIVEGGLVMLLLRIKISNVTCIPGPHMEPPQIFHYAIGQEIKPHHDFLFDGKRAYGRDGTYKGDRLATFLMYLNDGYEGGSLVFPRADFRYKGWSGDGIFFASQRDGKPDPLSLHAATPVTWGEKYILSQWIHDRPFAA